MAYWWATKNMPAAQARDWHGDKAEVLAAFHGWAPEVVEVIERTPQDAIINVPGQDRPFLSSGAQARSACWATPRTRC